MVGRAQEYIRAGDAFQVVPSQRFSLPFGLPPLALYRSLRRLNPSPFSFCLNLGDFALVGSSPEILVRVRDGKVTVRPIAGTRPRGATRAEDRALERDMLGDPKELAEHLMLLDLGRNDVGRVAKIGSVRVTDKMAVERYSHVMHIVSNVEGELDPERADVVDALCAGYPAGTVSGAPKIRAMEIIEELEPTRRGFYAGGVGYIGADGNMDTCIGLRTGLIKAGRLHVQAGGGVVADSDPKRSTANPATRPRPCSARRGTRCVSRPEPRPGRTTTRPPSDAASRIVRNQRPRGGRAARRRERRLVAVLLAVAPGAADTGLRGRGPPRRRRRPAAPVPAAGVRRRGARPAPRAGRGGRRPRFLLQGGDCAESFAEFHPTTSATPCACCCRWRWC
jgi:hypothetical protein